MNARAIGRMVIVALLAGSATFGASIGLVDIGVPAVAVAFLSCPLSAALGYGLGLLHGLQP